jgi:hypothetical protein
MSDREKFKKWVDDSRYVLAAHSRKEAMFSAWQAAITQQPSAVVPSGVWQFYQDGEWHTGMNNIHHRADTEAAGYKVRDLWVKPDQDPFN